LETLAVPLATVLRPFLSTNRTLPPQTLAWLTPEGILTLPLNVNRNGNLRSRLGEAFNVMLVPDLPARGPGGVPGGPLGTSQVGGTTAGRGIGCQSHRASVPGKCPVSAYRRRSICAA